VSTKEENERLYVKYGNFLRIEAEKAARRYPQYDAEELQSEAWLKGVKVGNPKFTKQRVAFDILDFVRHDLRLRNKNKRRHLTNILHEELYEEGRTFFDENYSYLDPCFSLLDVKEMIVFIVSLSKLAPTEVAYICLLLQGYEATDIAKKRKCTLASVCSVLYTARKKMKKAIREYEIEW